jgi:hypothetical protein
MSKFDFWKSKAPSLAVGVPPILKHGAGGEVDAKAIPPSLPQTEIGGKIDAEFPGGKTSESSQFAGLTGDPKAPPQVQFLGNEKAGEKEGGIALHPDKTLPGGHGPMPSPTPGPMGFVANCADMTDGQLRAAYPREYMSFKKRKEYATTHAGWEWKPAWNKFREFLLDMGPKPSPECTLDRLDSSLLVYGPGLCKWSTPKEQSNNKTDNIHVLDPVSGKTWTPEGLAKKHGVTLKTIYNRHAQGWTPLEMIAGKKDEALASANAALASYTPPQPAKPSAFNNAPAPEKSLRVHLAWPAGWKCPDPYVDDLENPIIAKKWDDWHVMRAWYIAWNAGEPCSCYPPKTDYFVPTLPKPHVLPAAPAKPQQWSSPPGGSDEDDSDEDEFDEDSDEDDSEAYDEDTRED